ncbi:hypothetical protein [Actinoplanes sp. NPDC026619]|uniref:hypothetical protein n=1 Tax=Actinoplanes sp. NPDC026619 TaxID=3155798 RepID=UPI0033D161CC
MPDGVAEPGQEGLFVFSLMSRALQSSMWLLALPAVLFILLSLCVVPAVWVALLSGKETRRRNGKDVLVLLLNALGQTCPAAGSSPRRPARRRRAAPR